MIDLPVFSLGVGQYLSHSWHYPHGSCVCNYLEMSSLCPVLTAWQLPESKKSLYPRFMKDKRFKVKKMCDHRRWFWFPWVAEGTEAHLFLPVLGLLPNCTGRHRSHVEAHAPPCPTALTFESVTQPSTTSRSTGSSLRLNFCHGHQWAVSYIPTKSCGFYIKCKTPFSSNLWKSWENI